MAETPGQVAYTAYWRSANPRLEGYPWATMDAGEQAHWEAAAQAAITAWWQAHEAVICGDEEETDA